MLMKMQNVATAKFMASMAKLMGLTGVIPPKVALKIRGIAKKMGDSVASFEEQRKSYIDAYAVRGEDGLYVKSPMPDGSEGIQIQAGKVDEMNAKLKDLGLVECRVHEITIDELGDKAFESLSVEDLFQLEFIVE